MRLTTIVFVLLVSPSFLNGQTTLIILDFEGTASSTPYTVTPGESGRVVKTLFEGIATANDPIGVSINASDLPSGLYYYQLRGGLGAQAMQSVILLKLGLVVFRYFLR